MTTPTSLSDEVRRRFLDRFHDAWAASDADQLMGLLAPDVRLRQPMLAPVDGHDAARTAMHAILAACPGVRAEIHHWVPTPTGLLIAFDLLVPGNRPLRWMLVDRFDLTGDRATLRISYWDLRAFFAGLVHRPEIFVRCWRTGARVRGALLTDPADPMPAPTGGSDGRIEIAEFEHRPRRSGPVVRGALVRDLHGPAPTRVLVGSPLTAALRTDRTAPPWSPSGAADGSNHFTIK